MERETIEHNEEELDRGGSSGSQGGGTSTPTKKKKGFSKPIVLFLITLGILALGVTLSLI